MDYEKPLLYQISPTRAIITNVSRWMQIFPEDRGHTSNEVIFTSEDKELSGCSFVRTGVVVDFPDDGALTLFCLKYL